MSEAAPYLLSKRDLARHFGAAASSYQSVNRVQEIILQRLMERLQLVNLQPKRIVDLGSGPGVSAKRLARHYRRAEILEVDISPQMLRQSARSQPRFFSRRRHLCADVENLALANQSAELVFSNLMLQWCNDLDRAFSEVNRCLKNNGLFMFSTFGPDTLIELRKSWQQVDDAVHVNAFVDMHDIGDALIRAGLENPVMETEKISIRYDSAMTLMRDLKALGANNVNRGRRQGLTGKNSLQKMLAEYEKWREDGTLPATYEVVYGHAWMPEVSRARRLDENTLGFPVTALKTQRAKVRP